MVNITVQTQGIMSRSEIDKIDGNRCQQRLDQSGQTIRYQKQLEVTFKTVDLHEGRRLFRRCAIKAPIYEEGDHLELPFIFPKKKNHKDTNFAIGGFLAGLHQSPLILFFFFRIY